MEDKRWEGILDFWFGGDIKQNYSLKWFPSSTDGRQKEVDKEITEKFGELLSEAEKENLSHWKTTPKSFVALIILIDQFSRHIYRGNKDKIKENDIIALNYSEEFLSKNWETQISVAEHIFLLMPLRHQATVERLNKVLKHVEDRLEEQNQLNELITKFKKTTFRRLQDIEGKEGWKEGNEILEFHEFDADETDMAKEPLFISVDKFLAENNAEKYDTLAISLSGGVDSMVLATIVKKLASKYSLVALAIHIDYANRPESRAEADFVEDWCKRKGIEFFQRRIDEVTRGVTKRDDYEKISREIRYSTYLKVLEGRNCPGVLFGHHKGDVQENIISNIMKGCSLLDLSGMHDITLVNGVPIWRPMLHHPKLDIFKFSHKYGIPYLLDTTPDWSTRGKMRKQLMPLLEDMYGVGYLDHLSVLANDSSQINSVFQSNLFIPFKQAITKTSICVYFDCKNYFNQPVLFWKEVLTDVCHSMLGISLIREKAIKEILLRRFRQLQYSQPPPCFLALRQKNKVFMNGSTLVIFRTPCFPPKSYFNIGTVIEPSKEYVFGPWTVKSELVDKSELPDKPKVEFLQVLSGNFTYYLPHTDSFTINPKAQNLPIKAADKTIKWCFPLVAENGKAVAGSSLVLKVSISADMGWNDKL